MGILRQNHRICCQYPDQFCQLFGEVSWAGVQIQDGCLFVSLLSKYVPLDFWKMFKDLWSYFLKRNAGCVKNNHFLPLMIRIGDGSDFKIMQNLRETDKIAIQI